jgi:DNA polymerase III epsilon subunit-like protein
LPERKAATNLATHDWNFRHDAQVANDEILISVDIEASGPTPGTGSMVSIGACLVEDPQVGIYLELKPLPELPWSGEAEAVHRLDRAHLEQHGLEPNDAMQAFDAWLAEVADGRQPVFVGFNSPFDWMFVADYFHRCLGRNPFGIAALDMKSYYMGRDRIARWAETSRRHAEQRYPVTTPHSHNALDDARGQAELALLLLQED